MSRIAPARDVVGGRTEPMTGMGKDVMAQSRLARMRTRTGIVISVLLAAALIGTLWVPFYNHLTPALGGLPFFYWYQLMWVPIVAILSAVAYLLNRLTQRSRTASAQSPDRGPGEAT
jgi:uncharacterized membrane protein